jgi:16S rRNA (adenine(1408)-N(1))-methyltransferase
VDVGTGDGRAVVEAARAHPDSFVLGLDANAAAMAAVSRRTAGPASKGGLRNAAFALASAECPPAELADRADLVTVLLPWGSLLRGVVGRDDVVTAGLVILARPGARIEMLVAPSDRDRAATAMSPVLDAARERTRIEAAWSRAGAELVSLRPAATEGIAASGSTWAKRLGLTRPGADRAAWRLVARRCP